MRNLLIVFVFIYIYSGFAREIEIEGKVRDANTYSAIPSVNIYVQNSPEGTTSGSNGTFKLIIRNPAENTMLIFEHIAFDTLFFELSDALETDDFYLQPRIIQFPQITVEAQRERPDIAKDIPQSIAIIEAKRFEVQGYVDAGDLLKTDQSIQIDENISGEKNISIRAGNAEDVIILYNGIKMNDVYDNRFDLSLINLEDIRQIQIIKGSNTALYGSEAFSGVINFIPKAHRNYLIRFMQRFGSYNSGDFNLQLNHNFFNRLNISYNFKKGANKRRYADDTSNTFHLENNLTYHTGNIVYNLSANPETQLTDQFSGSFIHSKTAFNDRRYNESILNLNRVFSVRFEGDIVMIRDLNMVASKQLFDKQENLNISGGYHNRLFKNDRSYLNMEKYFNFGTIDLLAAYQYENSGLDYSDKISTATESQPGVESGIFQQIRHGFVSILKIKTPTYSSFMQTADLDISYRYDDVANNSDNVVFRDPEFADDNIANNAWSHSTVKFSAHLNGNHEISEYTTFINYGTNIKFPTLFQQLSVPGVADPSTPGISTNLNPEKNRSLEVGFELKREFANPGNMDGWLLSGTYFENYYENKFRTYTKPGIPVSFYENVPTADISGFEGRIVGYFLHKKLTFEFAVSDYSISDKAAFPFKYDTKLIANMLVDHAGYSFQIHWFYESEQIGLIIDNDDPEFVRLGLELPAYQNLDIHLGKTFEVWKFKLFTNFTVRNLLNTEFDLAGIAIRDRRFYLSFGFEY